ncbi:878_t:CDS:2, partial [Ambispora gerdemannii]
MVDLVILNGTWTVQYRIGKGASGVVYRVIHNETQKGYAAKREDIHSICPSLQNEVKLLLSLQAYYFVPKVHWYGEHDVFRVCVMDLLGPSLKQVIKVFRTLPLPIVQDLAIQMVTIMECVHREGIVYRDVKPENFLLEYEFKLPEYLDSDQEQPPDTELLYQSKHTVSIIDFGSSYIYLDPKTRNHVPYNRDSCKKGTHTFVSLNVHKGVSHSRRDDLESLGYLFIYLIRGKLPWTGIKGRTAEEVWEKVCNKKDDFPLERLCAELPRGYYDFITYARTLSFSQDPDYNYLRRLLGDTKSESETVSPQILKFGDSTRNFEDPNACQVIKQNQRQQQQKDSDLYETLSQKQRLELFELDSQIYAKPNGLSNSIIQQSLDQMIQNMKPNSNPPTPSNFNQSTHNDSHDSNSISSSPITTHHNTSSSPVTNLQPTQNSNNTSSSPIINRQPAQNAPNIKGPMSKPSSPASRRITPTNNQIQQQPHNSNQQNNYNSSYIQDSNSNRNSKPWNLKDARYTQMGRNSLQSNNRSGDDNMYYNKDASWNLKDARYTQMGRNSLQSNNNRPDDDN